MNTQAQGAPSAIEISHVAIRQDQEGRYSLNDLHKAAGGEAKHKPSEWLRNQQTQDLITELEKDEAGIPASKTVRGRGVQGTYVVRELVFAYAMWISASFHLKVIRAYDAQQTQSLQNPQPLPQALTLDQIEHLIDRKLKAQQHTLPPPRSSATPTHEKIETRCIFKIDDLIYILGQHGYKITREK